MNNKGLCFRCEYRAQFLEEGVRSRFECGAPEFSAMSCYMFQPVKPICIKPREGDNRPMSLNYFSSRVERTENTPELELRSHTSKEGVLVYWQLKDSKVELDHYLNMKPKEE